MLAEKFADERCNALRNGARKFGAEVINQNFVLRAGIFANERDGVGYSELVFAVCADVDGCAFVAECVVVDKESNAPFVVALACGAGNEQRGFESRFAAGNQIHNILQKRYVVGR